MKKVIHIFIILLAMFFIGTAADAATYTINGTIKTPVWDNAIAHDVPVKYIKVIVMDEDTLFDDTEGSGHTAVDGTFSITFSDIVEAPDVYINVEDKLELTKKLAAKHDIKMDEICYIGDDVNDIAVLQNVGFPVSVANAAANVMSVAKYITKTEGGKGAVREVCDLILSVYG